MAKDSSLIPTERIQQSILLIRGIKVVLDRDLASMYGVETKVLVQSVKRNRERFPEDFMFQLTSEESDVLRSQCVTSKGRGGRQYAPYAFTEQGVAMLSGVLKRVDWIPCSREMRFRQGGDSYQGDVHQRVSH